MNIELRCGACAVSLLISLAIYMYFTSFSVRIWFWKVARWSIYIIHFNIVFSTFEALSFYFEFATIYKRYLNSDHSFHLSVSIEFVCLTIIMRVCIFILIFTYITVNLTFSSNDFTVKKKVSGICVYYFQFNFLDNYNF